MPFMMETLVAKVQASANAFVNATLPAPSTSPLNKVPLDQQLKEFVNTSPKILFICDYVIDGKLIGCLLVWEQLNNATHYEVFKKNIFTADSSYERILFLDKQNLIKERSSFVDYLTKFIGFNNLDINNILVFLDDVIKTDRIYEYKVIASRVPSAASEIDYAVVMQFKQNVIQHQLSDTIKLSDVSNVYFHDKRYGWLIALMNNDIPFFGENSLDKKFLKEYTSSKEILVPQNVSFLQNAINESINLFGLSDTFNALLTQIGGVPVGYVSTFINSLLSNSNSFNVSFFLKNMRDQIPTLDLLANLENTGFAVQVNLLIPVVNPFNVTSPTTNINLNSMDGITSAFDLLNRTILSVMLAQDSDTFKQLNDFQKAQTTITDVLLNAKNQSQSTSFIAQGITAASKQTTTTQQSPTSSSFIAQGITAASKQQQQSPASSTSFIAQAIAISKKITTR